MDEEIMYPVCPHRNVPAAYQRFLGPDSGGIERFFPAEPGRRADATLLIVTQHGKRAVRDAVRNLKATADCMSQAIGEFNTGLWSAWITCAAVMSFAARTGYAV